jgi:hypothetical protein
MIYDEQSLFIPNKKFGGVHQLVRTKRLLWLVALLAVLILPNATLAQTALTADTQEPSRGQRPRIPRPQSAATAQPDSQTSNPLVLGTSTQTVQIPGHLIVGNGRMEVVNSAIGGGVVTRNLYIL